MSDSLAALTGASISIWLDGLSRGRLTSGSLADRVAHDHVAWVTKSPTIFATGIAEGGAYDEQLRDLAARGVSVGEKLRALTTMGWNGPGTRPQRPLRASTSVKDPASPDTRYVVDLVAPGMVNTMPEATLRLVGDHGQVSADSIHGHYDQSQEVLGRLGELGIDYDDTVQVLEEDGVARFDASWDQLGDRLASTMRSLSARR